MSNVLTQPSKMGNTVLKQNSNPFPGLRPFGIEESHLFFGREGQSEEVLAKLSNNRFVAVIGASGTGKSSLIYCGLVPILYGGFISDAGSNWNIIACRPGNQPIDNLAQAIVKTQTQGTAEQQQINQSIHSAILRRSSLGLIESLKMISQNSSDNILLIIDQFEELFRFKSTQKEHDSQNESGAFVRLLVEAVKQSQVPIYTVLTMRSDFIGECAQFQDLTWLINKSNYLIPQMTRNDFKDAILGPVAVGNATIEPSLVQQLLNDVGDNPDQLPIMQHAMMRTWDYWLNNTDTDKALSLSEYEAIGKMEKALSEHANEAFDELSENGKRICEHLFKTITEKGSDNRGVRRPTRLEEIATIAHAPIHEVIEVVDRFRMAGRSFLTPAHEIGLTANSIIDLSHESLMRIWNRLKIWVDEESTAVEMYVRLSEAAALYQEGKTGLWRPPDLQLALNWEKKQQPSLSWAQRYNPAFERTMVFLHTSEKEFEAEELNKIKLQKRALRRTKIFALVLGSAAVVAMGIMIYAQDQKVKADNQSREANKQSIIAKNQRILAEKNAKEALEQKKIAFEQSREALKQKELADEQTLLANVNAQEANIQKNIANKKSVEANQQKTLAEKNAEEALKQKSAAEKAREEAYNRRLLSITQSMAVKSQQMDDDKDLKGLLAYQSYQFNNRYKGPQHNADIYSALYMSLKALNKKGFNVLKGHTDAINSIVFAPNSTIAYTAGSDGKILKWNLTDTTKTPSKIVDNKFINKTLAISSDGKFLACGTFGLGVELFDIAGKNLNIRYLADKGRNIASVTFIPNSKKLLVAADNNLIIWDIETNNSTIAATTDADILSITVSPNGKLVAGGTKSGKLLIWDISNNYASTILLDDSKSQIHALAFNNKGSRLAAGTLYGYIKIWDTSDKKLLTNVRGHLARIVDIKYSPNDKILATSSYDASIALWDADNLNTQPAKLKDHESWVLALAFNSDGTRLLSGSSREDRLIFWPIQTNETSNGVLSKLSRNMSVDEWSTYVGSDIPYEKTIK